MCGDVTELPSHGTLKTWSILLIDDGLDRYTLRRMSDPNFMALTVTVSNKTGLDEKKLTKRCRVSEPLNLR